jgi:tetratricopeptide (TPR) repeat protein
VNPSAPTPSSLAALFILAVSAICFSQEPDSVFLSANTDFESNDFEQAELKFQSLIEKGLISSELYFNLGTTHFRLGNEGEAMLWMRRAILAEPGMPEARQNIEFLRTRLGFLEFDDSSLSQLLKTLPPGTGRWTGTFCLWIGLLCAAGAVFSNRLRRNRSGIAALSAILITISAGGFALQHHLSHRVDATNFSTITSPNAAALTAPSPSAKIVIPLPLGSQVRVLQTSSQWCYVDIPGNLRGWVESSVIKSDWPIATQNPY